MSNATAKMAPRFARRARSLRRAELRRTFPALLFVALATGCFAGAAVAASPPASGSTLSLFATATTDYRDLGLSQSGGDPSVEAGLDYQHPSGFFVGLGANTVEYPVEAARRDRRSVETQIYTGYNWRNAYWSATTALTRYVYPDIDVDYDYDEVGAGFGYRERVFFTLSYTDALLGRGPSLLHAEATLALPIARGVELGGTLGRVDSDAFAGGRYTHWDAGASKTLGPVTLDLRFYANDAQGYAYYGEPLPNRWVLSVSYGFGVR